MKILIVGLGLIGGSYALGLSKKGHEVYGVDTNEETIKYAMDNKYIISGSNNPKDYIAKSDVVIIGLYPKKVLEFVKQYRLEFKKDQIITDVCGIKTSYIDEAVSLCDNAEYIGHHPMAGREKSGIIHSNIEMFKKANFLICPVESNTLRAVNIIKQIGEDLEFGRISIMSPVKHDKMIAYTSQLTHAIAVSLVNADTEHDTKDYIGDSYRDLTRIAKINENLWSELFFENKDYLIEKIEDFEKELDALKLSLETNDIEKLKEIFIRSTNKRKEME